MGIAYSTANTPFSVIGLVLWPSLHVYALFVHGDTLTCFDHVLAYNANTPC